MDGNRRYASQHSLPCNAGHELGFESLLKCLEVCVELGVEIVTVYAFSKENFSRPKEEVDGLMNLTRQKFNEFLNKESIVMEEQIIVNVFGRIELLPEDVCLLFF